jgi:hypothetical protein
LKSPYITSGRQNHLFDTMNLKPTCYKTNQWHSSTCFIPTVPCSDDLFQNLQESIGSTRGSGRYGCQLYRLEDEESSLTRNIAKSRNFNTPPSVI